MSYTMVPNAPMQDKTLSLRAKGLYACIASFAGLPGFQFTLSRFARACADSTYSIRNAARELQRRGYMRHYCSSNSHGVFSHAYDLYDTPQSHDGSVTFLPQNNRANGDLRMLWTRRGNFTEVPTSIMRSRDLPLQVKALYVLTKFLLGVPGFRFTIGALASYCAEKSKALRTAWRGIKLTGLLKQHRHPTGIHNEFVYTYELMDAPEMSTPYLTTHRADGSTAASSTIRGYINRMPCVGVIRRAVAKLLGLAIPKRDPLPSPAQADGLPPLIRQAHDAIASGKRIRVDGARLTRNRRMHILERLTPDFLRTFGEGFAVPSYVQRPLPYVITTLVRAVESNLTPAAELTADEAETIVDFHIRAIRRKLAVDGSISDQDLSALEEYKKLQSNILQSGYQTALIKFAKRWTTK